MKPTERMKHASIEAMADALVDCDPRFEESRFGSLTRLLGGLSFDCAQRNDEMTEPSPFASPASRRWVLMHYARGEYKR